MIVLDDEFKSLIPPLQPSEYQQLEANLFADGCRDPLVLWGDVLVDGHNRYEICKRLGIAYRVVQVEFGNRSEALLWIVRNQLGRRNLTDAVRIKLGLQAEPSIKELARERLVTSTGGKNPQPLQNSVKADPVHTDELIAGLVGKSRDSVQKVRFVENYADEKQKEDMYAGKASINETWQAVKKERRISDNRNERVKEIQQAQNINQIGIYPVIYADPPWRYEHSISDSRAIENQYPTMPLDDICNLPIAQHTTPNAILFLWATSPKLEEAMQVICAWGFTYRTCAVWIKDKLGMGYYFRQQHELLLVATKGSMLPPKPSDRLSSVIEANYEGHSHKPDRVYEIIESMYPEFEKLELFARNTREGWQVWGNEAHE